MSRNIDQKEDRKNKDKVLDLEYKEYYSRNPDIPWICKNCGKEKTLKEFISTYAMRYRCKECHKNMVNKWRNSSKPATDKIKENSYQNSANFIRSFKNQPCSICKNEYPTYILDFHHIEKKSENTSNYEKSKERIVEEINKCVVICANCHRDETQKKSRESHVFKNRRNVVPIIDIEIVEGCNTKICGFCKMKKNEENFSTLKSGKKHTYCRKCLRAYNSKFTPGRKRTTSEYLKSVKDNKPCKDCGSIYRYWVLDFDHIGEKTSNVGKLRGSSIESLKAEIEKCDLICANCHRKRTYGARNKIPKVRGKFEGKTAEFDLSQIRVSRCHDLRIVKSILNRHHYAGFGRSAIVSYVAYVQDRPAAVIKISPIVRKEVATSMGLDPDQTFELDRMCIVPEYQIKNFASKFISMVVKLIKIEFPNISNIISFADPGKGHDGTIYMASNWQKVGMSSSSYEYIKPDGSSVHKKTVFNAAKRIGKKEREFAIENELIKKELPSKHKFILSLK